MCFVPMLEGEWRGEEHRQASNYFGRWRWTLPWTLPKQACRTIFRFLLALPCLAGPYLAGHVDALLPTAGLPGHVGTDKARQSRGSYTC
jgi:hypothetical protein